MRLPENVMIRKLDALPADAIDPDRYLNRLKKSLHEGSESGIPAHMVAWAVRSLEAKTVSDTLSIGDMFKIQLQADISDAAARVRHQSSPVGVKVAREVVHRLITDLIKISVHVSLAEPESVE